MTYPSPFPLFFSKQLWAERKSLPFVFQTFYPYRILDLKIVYLCLLSLIYVSFSSSHIESTRDRYFLPWCRTLQTCIDQCEAGNTEQYLISCSNLMHYLFIILSYPSTCFEQHRAHHQEDSLHTYSIWFFVCHSSWVTAQCTGS